jgi:hypothetical protein
MPLGKPIKGLPGNKLLRHLTLELNAVRTLSGHGACALHMSAFDPKRTSPAPATSLGFSPKVRFSNFVIGLVVPLRQQH